MLERRDVHYSRPIRGHIRRVAVMARTNSCRCDYIIVYYFGYFSMEFVIKYMNIVL